MGGRDSLFAVALHGLREADGGDGLCPAALTFKSFSTCNACLTTGSDGFHTAVDIVEARGCAFQLHGARQVFTLRVGVNRRRSAPSSWARGSPDYARCCSSAPGRWGRTSRSQRAAALVAAVIW